LNRGQAIHAQQPDRRDYNSPLRDQRARDTRRAILGEARLLLSTQGYGATTMRDIASEAGIAVQTIYSSIGSKRSILSAFIDEMELEADIEEAARSFAAAEDPGRQLDLRAHFSRRIFGTGIETVELLMRSAGTAPEVQEALEEGHARHHASVKLWITDRWPDGVFRNDISRVEAADIIATLSGADTYLWLVRHYGWSPDSYESWLARTLREGVLRDPAL
jgi:AcrR family transcriptional regulator